LRVVSNTYTERLKLIKLMWHLYAYGHIKLFRQHCSAPDSLCAWCGLVPENMSHVLLDCKHHDLADHRDKLFTSITALISAHTPKASMKAWLTDVVPHIWGRSDNVIAQSINIRLTHLQQ
jgi:hypothetical protein